jgi:NCS1 family nucleobase:cation symporter-1
MPYSSAVVDYFRPSAWVVEPEPSTYAPSSKWSNKDMDPTPPRLRTWTAQSYVWYWVAGSFNISAWEVASSMLAIGLSWYRVSAFPLYLSNLLLPGVRLSFVGLAVFFWTFL